MEKPVPHEWKIHSERYSVLEITPPFTDIILQSVAINEDEFARISDLAMSYPNDPRMIEMVRRTGDGTAKIPYLMDAEESRLTILAALHAMAEPHLEHLTQLPEAIQATIRILLSVNSVPRGYEAVAIPALLEINEIQGQMIKTLQVMMAGRQLARDFHNANHAALQALDDEWPEIRKKKNAPWPKSQVLPHHPQMQFAPVFRNDRLVHVAETCVIVDPPYAHELQRLIPAVLKRPLAENEKPPATGSADWLLREVGKIGRHFTRALLDIITTRLVAEQLTLEAHNYELINRHAQEALKEFVEKTP